MLHSVGEVVQQPVVRKPVEEWEAERRTVRYCLEVMSRMQRYSVKISRARNGWLSMTVCGREAG